MKSEDKQGHKSTHKIVVLGAKGVGKSALTVRFLTKRFIGDYRSDTDMLYKCSLNIDGAKQHIEIMDTSPEPDDVTEAHLHWADAFVLVYSITDKSSFKYVSYLLEILSKQRPNCNTLIIGTKVDLHHLREVDEIDGRCSALNNSCYFNEISAAEGYTNVISTFENFFKEVKSSKNTTTTSATTTTTTATTNNNNNFSNNNNNSSINNNNINNISSSESKKLSCKGFTCKGNTSPKERKISVTRMLGSLIGRSSPPPNPITQLIVLDRSEFSKAKIPIRQL